MYIVVQSTVICDIYVFYIIIYSYLLIVGSFIIAFICFLIITIIGLLIFIMIMIMIHISYLFYNAFSGNLRIHVN